MRISSSRVHCTRTGAPTIFERIAASHAKSGFDLRPKPPPSSVTWHSTSVFSSPSAAATYCRVSLGDWVDVMTLTGRTLASTSAAGGSMGVWMKYGTKYSASITLSAAANASSTFPRSRMTWPPVRAASRSWSS